MRTYSSLLLFALAAASALAQDPAPPKVQGPDDPPVQTKHSIVLRGTKIDYTATAGYIPIRNDQNEIEGRMFFVAYTKDGEAPGKRPLTFAYNGGPGSASLWLHLGTLGPRRVPMNDNGTLPRPPYQVIDNQETWLGATDVVMVDAMGTGYSRLAKPEFGKKFYGVRADIRAFGEFIREYAKKYDRFKSPLFLAGESYGGIRTAGLSNYLLSNGFALNGAIIVSGTMNFQTLDGARGNDLPFTSFLPTFTGVAWYHKKLKGALAGNLEAAVAESEKFANGEYTLALQKGSSLSPEEETHIAKRLSELTGLKESYIKQSHLRVPEFRFFKELLRDEGLTTGRYDARLTGTDALDTGDSPEYDASDAAVGPVFMSCINDYLTHELGYNTDLKYRMYKTDPGWDMDVEEGYPDTSEDLRQALNQNPYMKLMFAFGRYDLACPYFGTKYTLNHMDLKKSQLDRISYQFYPAGHMMYIEKSSREKLFNDVNSFIAGAK